jgi:hypothetical protein
MPGTVMVFQGMGRTCLGGMGSAILANRTVHGPPGAVGYNVVDGVPAWRETQNYLALCGGMWVLVCFVA